MKEGHVYMYYSIKLESSLKKSTYIQNQKSLPCPKYIKGLTSEKRNQMAHIGSCEQTQKYGTHR